MKFTKFVAGLLAAVLVVPALAIKTNADVLKLDSATLDKAFGEYLTKFDINSDGMLDTNELDLVTEINVNGLTEIKSLNYLDYFKKLEKLSIRNLTNISSLNITYNTKLKYIDAEYSGLRLINVDKCPDLQHLDLYATDIVHIGLANNTKLTYLDVAETYVKELSILYCPSLINTYKTEVRTTNNWHNIESYGYGNYKDKVKDSYLAFNAVASLYTECPEGYVDYLNTCSTELANAIYEKYDKYHTGLLSQSDINNITKLSLHDLESLDEIKQFKNLKDLTLYRYRGTSFDAKSFPNLESLYIFCNDRQDLNIDLSALPNLKLLSLYGISNKELNFSNNPELTTLEISSEGLTSLNIKNNNKIECLKISETNLKTIDVSDKTTITALSCSKNDYLTSVILPTNLVYFSAYETPKLTTLDVSNRPDLYSIEVSGSGISSLDISGCPNLGCISSVDSNIYELDISDCPKLLEYYNSGARHIDAYGSFHNPFTYYGPELGDLVGLEVNDGTIFYTKDNPKPTAAPTPTTAPSKTPTSAPVNKPTSAPSVNTPTVAPTTAPNSKPTTAPSAVPTSVPAVVPTSTPNGKPTAVPTTAPADKPVAKPTSAPVNKPTVAPTAAPDTKPTKVPNNTTTPGATTAPGKPTATPTPKPSKPQTGVSDKAGTVEDFAERLYTTCLGRDAEAAGKDFWTSELKSGKTGAEVAQGFFFSPEYEARKLNNQDFIGTLYATFMNRTPADEEVAYWSSEMDNGKTRKDIFDGFVNSPEWADICLTYGIRSGGLAEPTFEKEASAKVIAFAERLYTTCLGREAEKEGLEWWSAELANLRQTGTVAASGFFYSPEFISLKTSDDEYVTRLYRTFMGREPEEAGFKFWTSELKSGKDRQYVFDGFSVAPEFANLCAEAGIMR